LIFQVGVGFSTGNSIAIYGDTNCVDMASFGNSIVRTTITVPAEVWYHLAVVFNYAAGSINIYVNGTFAGNSTGISMTGMNTNRTGNWFGYNGRFRQDEIKLYNKALSQAQVMLDMTHIGIPSGVC
jgi:hypothetical protein